MKSILKILLKPFTDALRKLVEGDSYWGSLFIFYFFLILIYFFYGLFKYREEYVFIWNYLYKLFEKDFRTVGVYLLVFLFAFTVATVLYTVSVLIFHFLKYLIISSVSIPERFEKEYLKKYRELDTQKFIEKFKTSRKIPIYRYLEVLKKIDPYVYEKLNEIMDLFSLVRLVRLFGKKGASSNYHHSEEYGLLKHTFEVVRKLLERKDEINSLENEQKEKALVVLGLLHDAGKVYDKGNFKYQNALSGYVAGRVGIELEPEILSRLIYVITLQHTEYARFEDDELLRILREVDSESVKEDISVKRKRCKEEFMAKLKEEIIKCVGDWNSKNFFKVIINPSKEEALVNMNLVDKVYNSLGCSKIIRKSALLKELREEGYLKNIDGSSFASFEIKQIGVFPALILNLKKFPIPTDLKTLEFIPEYRALKDSKKEELKERILTLVAHSIGKNGVYVYRDREGRKQVVITREFVDFLKNGGIQVGSLRELGEILESQVENVNIRHLKIKANVVKVPYELLNEFFNDNLNIDFKNLIDNDNI